MTKFKKGQKVKLTSLGKHGLKGMSDLIGREFMILRLSNLKALNPQYAKINNVNYDLYALFRFTNGREGFAWFDDSALELVE